MSAVTLHVRPVAIRIEQGPHVRLVAGLMSAQLVRIEQDPDGVGSHGATIDGSIIAT